MLNLSEAKAGSRLSLVAGVKDEATVDSNSNALGAKIEGVICQRLHGHHDHRGSLTQVVDVRTPFWSEPVVYAYAMTIRPGRIKGWGMHRLQTDRYSVLGGRVRVVLYDGREKAGSYGHFEEFFFTEESHGLLMIPPGVWHAAQNWGDADDALIVNYPTRAFNADEPDKYRVDPHSGEIPFDWSLNDG